MHIDWAALSSVFAVSFGVAVGMIVLFAIGVSLLSTSTPGPDGPQPALAATDSTTRTTEARARPDITRRITAWICFLACGLSVAYGLHIIIAK
jgi:hypothetical protein